MEQKQVSSKKQSKNNCQIVLIIITLLGLAGYGACLGLFWEAKVWTDAFKTFNDGPILSSLNLVLHGVIYSFSSWKSALIYLGAPIVLAVLFSNILLKSKGEYLKAYSKLVTIIFSLSFTVGIVASFIAVIKSLHIFAMICFIGYGFAIILFSPLIMLQQGMCKKCGMYGTKVQTGFDYYRTEQKNYVPGGYRYDTYDLKDKDGVKVGEVETKKYEEAHEYSTYTSHTTQYFTCKNCGDKTVYKS